MARLASILLLPMALSAAPVAAQTITLDFEGVGDGVDVSSFYNGFGDGAGHVGPDYGVIFSSPIYAEVDSPSNANEPSGSTVIAFTFGFSAVMDVESGFVNEISFAYSASTAGTLAVYDDFAGQGNLLGSIALAPQHNAGCESDPAFHCNWSRVDLSFAGVARSISFADARSGFRYDDLTLTLAEPVPEPATWAALIVGFVMSGASLRRSRRLPNREAMEPLAVR